MPIFDWLFGRSSKVAEAILPEPNYSPLAVFPENSAPTAMADGEARISYRIGEQPIKRTIRPLFCTPDNLLTTIDLTVGRVRTYRIDRIEAVFDQAGSSRTAMEYLAEFHPTIIRDLNCTDQISDMAIQMRKAMISQGAIMAIMARVSGGTHREKNDVLIRYLKRDNRFAVRTDYLHTGRKAESWSVLAGMLASYGDRSEDLEIYVKTLRDEWENPARIDALGSALTEMANLNNGPTIGARRVGEKIMELFR